MKPRHYFTVAEDREILAMRAEKMSYAQIAEKTGMQPRAINSRIALLKSRFVTDPDDVQLNRISRPFSQQDGNTVMAMRAAGMTFVEISKETGFAVGSMHTIMSKAAGKPVISRSIEQKAARAIADRKARAIAKGPVKRKSAPLEMVRCLGGCEQQFPSPDRMRIRICPSCKSAHKNISTAAEDFRLCL